MDVYNKQQLFFLNLLCAFGSVLTQTDIHLVCPSHNWKPKDHITLQCFVQKSSYPAKCVTANRNNVIFSHSNVRVDTYDPMCTLTDVQGSCVSNGDCRCGTGNSSHFLFEYEFTATTNNEGYWDCYMDCYNGLSSLSFSQSDCDNRVLIPDRKCLKNDQCKRGTCRVNENMDDVCDCTGTGYIGTSCEKLDPFLIALICVSTLLGLLMAANCAGVYCARKQRSGGQQNAPPADAPPASAFLANAAPDNAPPDNAPPDNAPPDNAPPDNAPPDNAPQVAGSAGPFTGQAVPTTPYDEPEFSVAGSEASEGTEYSASEVSEV